MGRGSVTPAGPGDTGGESEGGEAGDRGRYTGDRDLALCPGAGLGDRAGGDPGSLLGEAGAVSWPPPPPTMESMLKPSLAAARLWRAGLCGGRGGGWLRVAERMEAGGRMARPGPGCWLGNTVDMAATVIASCHWAAVSGHLTAAVCAPPWQKGN